MAEVPVHPMVRPSSDPFLQADTADCVIPFIRVGKLILVQGKADTTQGNFILDTGAPGLVLNSTYFRDYPLIESRGDEQKSITSSSERTQRILVNRFTLGTFHYSRVESDLLSLGHIENLRGVKILGLLGVSLFKECELVIDPVRQVLRLHHIRRKEAKTYRNPLLTNNSNYITYPFDIKENRILVKVKMADKVLRFVLDCAAESNLVDSRLPQRVLDSISIIGRVVLSGSDVSQKEALSGMLSGLSMGPLAVEKLPVIITSLANTCFDGLDCVTGVLGDDFLSRYQIAFNFVTCKMYIWQ